MISISDKSALSALLSPQTQPGAAEHQTGTSQDTAFADKLANLLSENAQNPVTEQTKAQSIAEVLHLQMLRTTLEISGEPSTDTPVPHLFDRQSATLQALVNAYSSNAPENSSQPALADTTPLVAPTPASAPDAEMPSQPLQATKGGQWLEPIIAKASRRYGVDTGLIKAVIKAESNFNPTAVSSAGARGLMQLMPSTARSLGVKDSFDPEQNVMAGTRFLRDLLDRYNGDLDSALAAYNWGPGNVDRRPDRLPHETRNYLALVKQLYNSYTV